VSAESEGREGTRDLDLTTEDADRVKGGMLPIDGGAGGTAYIPGTHKKHKKHKKHKNQGVGPYKGNH
jgi:hypothetical protein